MSEAYNVQSVNLQIGSFNGATELPMSFIPSGGGGVTAIEAWLFAPSAGTVITGQVVTMGSVSTGGTPAINGTVGAFAGTIVTAAGVVHKLTISDAWIQGGEFLGFDQASGTVPAGTYIQLHYVHGRGTN